jgi:hypothetical protein
MQQIADWLNSLGTSEYAQCFGKLRQALAAFTDQGNKLLVPFYQGLLAEIEAQGDEGEH